MFGSNDITWCADECDNLECFRNIKNRESNPGLFSMAYFKNTDICPDYEEEGAKTDLRWLWDQLGKN